MFCSESIQDGGKQICSESRLAETGVDRKEFREVFKAFPFTVTIEFYRRSGVRDRDKTFSLIYFAFPDFYRHIEDYGLFPTLDIWMYSHM